MNSLKNHLSLIIPLVALLFALESILLVNRTLRDYESKLGKNYAIILASKKELSLESLRNKITEAQALSPINAQIVLDRLKNNVSQANLILLKKSLPYFYSLTLNTYPSDARLIAIQKTLENFEEIVRIETFTKSHNQIYQLLLIINGSIMIFSSLIALISLLLMFKQIEIWKFQHIERMEIMTLFGAPLWMRSQILFRLACIDTILATLIVVGGLFYISQNPSLLIFFQELGLNPEIFSPFLDSIVLLLTGLTLSLISVWIVSLQQKD
ncbi:FtsX-like permease family protein [Helicobacter turcicus]|uniref:Cell division protein FtsX n=1 Tax=Helicobacter turcicus TaxID=2867412 RepID=A0ABS7JKK1_9HELI|nr:FtsX-like permease family protein [Helicobacter turcicus]MBX7489918.1 cell division protein FtsX [Helicobacter turcicus]MBX7544778.1 cell division protein FtsX [Helicobacter turcicus]